jgi:hypothetical protein
VEYEREREKKSVGRMNIKKTTHLPAAALFSNRRDAQIIILILVVYLNCQQTICSDCPEYFIEQPAALKYQVKA